MKLMTEKDKLEAKTSELYRTREEGDELEEEQRRSRMRVEALEVQLALEERCREAMERSLGEQEEDEERKGRLLVPGSRKPRACEPGSQIVCLPADNF